MGSLRRGRAEDADWLWLIRPLRAEFPLATYPDLTDDTLARYARAEAAREREFYRRMEERLRQRIPQALTEPNPEAAVEQVLRTERAFLQAHEEAAASRVHAAIQRDRIKQLSPAGAYWRMSPIVKEHTPDCIAMNVVGFWPWSVLDRINPPLHPGCQCELLTFDEAVALGFMPDQIPDLSGADAKADEIVRAYGLLQEAFWLETDTTEALAAAVAQFAETACSARGDVALGSYITLSESPQNVRGSEPAAGTPAPRNPRIVVLNEAAQKGDNGGAENVHHTSVMVALYPDRDVQDGLAVRDGEDPAEIHLTLAFLGKMDDLPNEDLCVQTVRRWAEGCPPLEGEVSGYGYFTGNPDSESGKVTYASVDLPELPEQRQRLVDELGDSGHPPARNHGFTPHMTLDYASRRPSLDKPIPLTFSKVTLAWGDRHYVFPLTGKPYAEQIMESLVDFAKEELDRAGLNDSDSDYEGMLGPAILKCVKAFSEAGHSGMSAAIATDALNKLLRYQPLTPLTSDPSEWNDVSEEMGRPAWQSRRNPAAFSYDGGKTWEVMEAAEQLPLTALDLEEIQWDRRFAKGTVYGGRFMPRRGGFAPRVALKDILRALLGKDAPNVVQRGGQRPEARVPEGMASPPTPEVPNRLPGTPPKEFAHVAQEIDGIVQGIAQQSGAQYIGGPAVASPDRVDTEGFRDFSGHVEIGAMGAMALNRYAEMSRKGQHVDDDTAASVYHTLRTTFHEATHNANPLSAAQYADPAHFTLEEALTEEMAHVLTQDYLKANGGHDALRWLSRKPHDYRAQGVYGPQRAALLSVLDSADVPLDQRRNLLHQLSFAASPEQRLDILGGLYAKAHGISPPTAKARVRKMLSNASGADPLGQGAQILRTENPVDRRMRVHVGATVKVGDRYEGRVSDAGWDQNGEWFVEVEAKGRKGDIVWRYPNMHEVETLKDAPRAQLKGDKVHGPVREGDTIEVKTPQGTQEMGLLRVEPEDAMGWKAEAAGPHGSVVLLRPSSVDSVKRVKAGGQGETPDAAEGAGLPETPHAPGTSQKRPETAPEPPQSTPPPPPEPQKAATATLHDVHGPTGYDARSYQDPRRSLITKVRALPKGETLDLADGTKIQRGQHGDSALITRPDGSKRRYATANRMANAEMPGIAQRHGLAYDPVGQKRLDDEVALAGMASPAAVGPNITPEAPERGPVAQEVLGDHVDTQAKHTVLVEGIGRVYTPERRALHEQIISEFLEGHAPPPPDQREVLFTAGAPGSGKSTILKSEGVEVPPDAVEVNPDLVKEKLPEFQAMATARDAYAGAGVHEESSALAREIRDRAREQGLNIVVDGVGNSVTGKFERKMRDLHERGYHVQVVVAHLPLDEGRKRVASRAERSGRTVPGHIVQRYYETVPKRFVEYSHDDFLDVRLYSTDVPRGEPAKLIAHKPEGSNELDVRRPADLEAFRSLGKLGAYGGPEAVGGLPSGLRRLPGQASAGRDRRSPALATASGGSRAAGQASPGTFSIVVPDDLTQLSSDELDLLDAEVLGGTPQDRITEERQRRAADGKVAVNSLLVHPPEELAKASEGDLQTLATAALHYYLPPAVEHFREARSLPHTPEPGSPVAQEAAQAAKDARYGMMSPGTPKAPKSIRVKVKPQNASYIANALFERRDSTGEGPGPLEDKLLDVQHGQADALDLKLGDVQEMLGALSEYGDTESKLVDRLYDLRSTLEGKGMASPGLPKLKLFDSQKPKPKNVDVTRSKMEAPPKPVLGIPDYGDVKLKDVKAAGGSNGARFQEDPEGRRWLVKTYKGNRDRVATELLANAIYRELGVSVPNAGTTSVDVPHYGATDALTYPLVDGELRKWHKPSEDLADGFVADALLANWDVVGLAQDNVLWNGDTPIRLDQGGTLEYRAMGSPKPFGPVPAELWTMNKPGGQAFRRMKITDEALRAEAADAEARLTPDRIDELVDAAPFKDEAMRERVRDALKDRVDWLGRFSRGEEDTPKPLDGPDTRASFEARDADLETLPDEDAALDFYESPEGREAVDNHLRSNSPKHQASKEVQTTVATIDALLGDKLTRSTDEWNGYIELPSLDALGTDTIDELDGKWFRERSYMRLQTEFKPTPGTVSVRVNVPEGMNAIMPGALEGITADHSEALLPRNLSIQIVGGEVTPDGATVLDAMVGLR